MSKMNVMNGAAAPTHVDLDTLWVSVAEFPQIAGLGLARQPGVYVVVWTDAKGALHRYVGASGRDVVGRARSHVVPRSDGLEGILLLVGASRRLSSDAAFAVERLVHQYLTLGGLPPTHPLPFGSFVDDRTYGELRSAVGMAMVALKRAGHLPLTGSDRRLLAGPLGYERGVGRTTAERLPRAVMRCRGVEATVAIDEDGLPHLLPGSRIRCEESLRIARVTHTVRLEALFSGAIGADGTVLRPMRFSSWALLSRVVQGAPAGGPGQWRLDDGRPVATALTHRIRRTIARLKGEDLPADPETRAVESDLDIGGGAYNV